MSRPMLTTSTPAGAELLEILGPGERLESSNSEYVATADAAAFGAPPIAPATAGADGTDDATEAPADAAEAAAAAATTDSRVVWRGAMGIEAA